jgi:hypothetical protein
MNRFQKIKFYLHVGLIAFLFLLFAMVTEFEKRVQKQILEMQKMALEK